MARILAYPHGAGSVPQLGSLTIRADRVEVEGMGRRRKFWGWGFEGEGPDAAQAAGIAGVLAKRFGVAELELAPEPRVEDLKLPAPRMAPPPRLAELCSTAALDRASHTYGKSYRDIVRAVRGQFEHPPDAVAFPRDEDDVVALLDWCSDAELAAIPYGGGSSVVGGVEPRVGERYRGTVSIDLMRLGGVLEIDPTSRAARVQAGIYGPALEDALRPHGLTLRHFPQSFELSTLGGWIATRAGGHYATLYTHIDDFVESLRLVTPSGIIESRRLPGSGAGPSPDRLAIGSEGILGIIVEAWMRSCPSPASTPRTAACSIRWRPPSPARDPATPRCWCWASSRPTTRSRPGCSAPSSAAATPAARCPRRRDARAPTRPPPATGPPVPGAGPSSTPPTCGTSWCAPR
jgi:hypothetical protein